MEKDLSKNERVVRNRLNLFLAIIVIMSPIIKLIIFDRYYDIEQFFVPDAYNYDLGDYAELGGAEVSQQFTARGDNLSGFDIQFSGTKDYVTWLLTDQSGELIRNGEVRNDGESRVTNIRFLPILDSENKVFIFTFSNEALDKGVQISYSDERYCTQCSLMIHGDKVDGNINMVPVYKASDPIEYIGILYKRVCSSVGF